MVHWVAKNKWLETWNGLKLCAIYFENKNNYHIFVKSKQYFPWVNIFCLPLVVIFADGLMSWLPSELSAPTHRLLWLIWFVPHCYIWPRPHCIFHAISMHCTCLTTATRFLYDAPCHVNTDYIIICYHFPCICQTTTTSFVYNASCQGM